MNSFISNEWWNAWHYALEEKKIWGMKNMLHEVTLN